MDKTEYIIEWRDTCNAIDKERADKGREGWKWFSKWYQSLQY